MRLTDIRRTGLPLAAAFLILSGGAWAQARGSEREAQKRSVTTSKLDRHAITGPKVASNSIGHRMLRRGAVTQEKIRRGAVRTGKLADGSVSKRKLAPRLRERVLRRSRGRRGPPGPAGAEGPKGDPGPQGPQGPPGEVDESTLTSFWRLAGNSGTDPADDFLGTLDNVPLELRVHSARALRLEPVTHDGVAAPNVIAGSPDNAASPGVHSATVSGGGRSDPSSAETANRVTASLGTVGGGGGNVAGGKGAVVSGGSGNEASASRATVAGGLDNAATGSLATVGGGADNIASGNRATVPGGQGNSATGQFSFAAGRRAKADHHGAFVWGDFQNADLASSANNQFIARAGNGFFLQSGSALVSQDAFLNTSTGAHLTHGGIWTSNSDRNLKSAFRPVDPAEAVAKVAALPIASWEYDAEPGVRHLGPTAQDFHDAFGLGADDRHLAALDASGVALAAIKGLAERNATLEARVEQLELRLATLEARLGGPFRVSDR